MQATIVIGHKNPDTDSICSAIGYAELKRRATGENFLACRAGEINSETQFVLDRFSVQPPKLITSLGAETRRRLFSKDKGHKRGIFAKAGVGAHAEPKRSRGSYPYADQQGKGNPDNGR